VRFLPYVDGHSTTATIARLGALSGGASTDPSSGTARRDRLPASPRPA
jgi:hypothetical protein